VVVNEKQGLGTGGWGLGNEALPAADARSMIRSIRPAAQEGLPAFKKIFLTERCGNIIENKGPLWKTLWRSGNLIENKGGYPLKA
jgi:hypothetical protein